MQRWGAGLRVWGGVRLIPKQVPYLTYLALHYLTLPCLALPHLTSLYLGYLNYKRLFRFKDCGKNVTFI